MTEAARFAGAVGGSVSVKGITSRAGGMEWLSAPLVPVTVRRKVPVGVDEMVVMVMVVEPDVVALAGLKLALAPAGKPVTAKPTEPVNEAPEITLTVKVVLFPGATLCVEGEKLNEKSGVTVMVRVAGLGSVTP